MMSKGKAPYVRSSNQSYQQMPSTQAPIPSFQRSHHHFPQAGQPLNIPSVRIQPSGMQYAAQHVNVMPQTIVQTVPPQNQVRTFIPLQSSQFVQNVQTSTFDSTSQYNPYMFYGPAAAVPQQMYQAPTSQAIPQNLTGTSHMQMQPTPQSQSTSSSVSSQQQQQQQQQSSLLQDKKKAKVVVRITDPKQGGKDVTDEILKNKKESSISATGLGLEKEKIKAEFAAKVAATKVAPIATRENCKNGIEENSQVNEEQDLSSLTGGSDTQESYNLCIVQPLITDTNTEISHQDNNDTSSNGSELINNKDLPCMGSKDDISGEYGATYSYITKDGTDAMGSQLENCMENVSKTDDYEFPSAELSIDTVSLSTEDNEQATIHKYVPGELENVQDKKSENTVPDHKDSLQLKDSSELTESDASAISSETVVKHPNHIKKDSTETTLDNVLEPIEASSADTAQKDKHCQEDNEVIPLDPTLSNNNLDDAASVELVPSGFESGATSSQVSKKKKPKHRMKEISSKGAKDADLMSAFTDKPEAEIESFEADKEVKADELTIIDESWENKEIGDVVKPEKRICYDRDFLLGFQLNNEKPKDLPDIELVLPEAHPPTKPIDRASRMQQSSHNDFMPQFMRQSSGNRQVGMGRGGKGGRASVAKKIIPTSFETKVELKKSENAWVRPSEKVTEGEENLLDDLFRKARGILNKLTPEKFPRLVLQMKSLDMNTEDKLKGVIDIIFEKAISEPGFSAAYAKLCNEISTVKIQLESGKGPTALTFKRTLLNKCQNEFEKEKTDEQQLEKEQSKHFENADEEKNWQEQLRQRRYLTKKRSLGNIRFIGELFKLKMLTEAIMHTCVIKLLKDGDEESLECLCQLLSTIGKDLDVEKAKPRNDQYFEQINKVVQQKKVCSRVIFMLQNIQELRATNWIARRVADAPKTIGEIHNEAKQEEMQMQIAHQQAAQKRVMNKGGRESPAMMRGPQTTEEGWNQVPLSNKNNRSIQVDPSKLKLTKRTDSQNISLGPGGRPGAWAQGASGGSSRFGAIPSNEDSRQGNRFQALSSSEMHRLEGKGRAGSRSGQQSVHFGRLSGSSSGRRNQQQFTDEKAAALESVRRITTDQAKSTSPTNSSPKVTEDGKEEDISSNVTSGTTAESELAAEPTDAKIKKETKLTIEEFMVNRDLKEAENCIREINTIAQKHVIVSEAISVAIEKKADQVQAVGSLLREFVKSELISLADLKKGLSEILEFADDIAVDIPHIWTNLGIILGPVVHDSSLSFSELELLIYPLIRCNKAALLMSKVIYAAAKLSSNSAVAVLWKNSGMKWETLLGDESDVDNFISKNNMEFTITSQQQETLGDDFLEVLKSSSSCSCERAIEWIKKRCFHHSDLSFTRNLCTAVYTVGIQNDTSNVVFDAKVISKFKKLLITYIDGDRNRELQALFAAQTLAETLKHPKDFLRGLLDALYDEEIVSEYSVTAWEKSEEEQQGKGVALESVKEFLQWLKNSEEESVDKK